MITKNRVSSFILALVFFATLSIFAAPAMGQSNPTITGNISGVELCPQSVCGAAIFTGTFQGSVRSRPAAGFFWTAVNHDPLPTYLGQSVAITGGKWNLSTVLRRFQGPVEGGTLTCSDMDCLTFDVRAVLELIKGGSGKICFSGVLDHTQFPPTVDGQLLQDIAACSLP